MEQVPASRQLPHHLAGLDVLQAHGAQGAPPGLAAVAALRATRARPRVGEADRGGEDGEQEQRRGGDDDAVAGEGAVIGVGARRRWPSAVQEAEHP